MTESVSTGPADARLRIVSERVDLIDNLVISVSVSFWCCPFTIRLLLFARDVFFTVFDSDRSPKLKINIKRKENMGR